MARTEDHDESRRASMLDAIIDEEARALLSVDARNGFDARVMARVTRSASVAVHRGWPRLALAGAALSLVLGTALGILWWASAPGSEQPLRDWAAQPASPTPAGSDGGTAREGTEAAEANAAAPGQWAAAAPGDWPQGSGEERGQAPAGGEEAGEADAASGEGVAPRLSIASLQAPEPLRVPSLRVDALQIDAVQVPSLTMERREPEKKPEPASGPDKE